MQVFPIWFNFRSRKQIYSRHLLQNEGIWSWFIYRQTLQKKKSKYGDGLEVSKRFYFSVFPSPAFSKMVTDHRFDEENNQFSSAFGSILFGRNVSFYGRFAYIELPCIASRSQMTTSRVFPQIDEHLAWITPYFEGNYSNGCSFGASNIEHHWK